MYNKSDGLIGQKKKSTLANDLREDRKTDTISFSVRHNIKLSTSHKVKFVTFHRACFIQLKK